MPITAPETTSREAVGELLRYIDRSPSPWHAVASAQAQLQTAGFQLLHEHDSWDLHAGGRYLVIRDDAALLAFIVGSDTLGAGFRLIGAHTDSPCLRVKTQGAHAAGGYLRLATEVYGSPILATFTDRDLMLAGRVVVRDANSANGMRTILVRLDETLVRLPNLPIHMNRTVNDEGLKIHKHSGLNLLGGSSIDDAAATSALKDILAAKTGVGPAEILAIELCAVDGQAPAFFGLDHEFIAARQLDNLSSCHAAISAMITTQASACTALIGLFDHEEVGSESRTGAAGTFLQEIMARIAATQSAAPDALARSVAQSWHLSADMAHAHHPAHPECYDALHTLKLNAGVALKINASQRYATNALGEAFVVELAAQASVPLQKYVHRADLACGSTIGPISATRLGVRTVDIGAPMWAMHSCRESAGADDHALYIKLMQQFLAGPATGTAANNT
jgi:aspartyl aminopeptidase